MMVDENMAYSYLYEPKLQFHRFAIRDIEDDGTFDSWGRGYQTARLPDFRTPMSRGPSHSKVRLDPPSANGPTHLSQNRGGP